MTRSRLRCLLACPIVAGFVATASASPAPPTITVDKTFGKVAGWSIAYSGSLSGCLAAATYHDGTTIWFGYGGSGHSAFLAFTNSRWRSIEPGQSYSIGMRARGAGDWHGNFVGFERNGDKGVFTSSLKDNFVSDLADAGSLAVSVEGRQLAALSLVGSLDALQAVSRCEKQSVVAQARSDGSSAAPGDESAKDKSSQGTGFFVSDQGHVLTNNHVIDGCTEINVARVGAPPIAARLVAKDATNDLAVLSTGTTPGGVPPLSLRPRVGQSVFVYGYPLNGLLATTGNFTIGNVTATAGLGDDTRQIQISAPVQPGNSGGPLVDQYGNVVGVIVAKLNALKVASITSDLAQNVNFAIKSTIVLNFLEANGIEPPVDAKTTEPMTPETIAEKVQAFTVRVVCHP